MSSEFNYVVNVDTSRVMGAMTEVRSQMGMALGSPTGFASPAMSMQDVSGGAAAGFAQMAAGLSRPMGGMGSSFGGTFTNPAMAYSPHYGMIQAETSLQQEWLVNRYGTQAAQIMRPPGVGAGEYALGVAGNSIDRELQSQHSMRMATQNAFYSSAGGLVAGEAAGWGGGIVGGLAGSAIAKKLGFGGAAGKWVGGIAGSLAAFSLANDFVSDKISEHFAEVEQIGGVTRELGEIAGSGRGLNRVQRYDLGVSARQAAKDIGMNVQEMGDVLALGRQNGMLPTGADPEKARGQFRDFARAIDEGAQMLHTSIGNATQIIKGMTGMGMGAQEGVMKLIGMGAEAGISPQAMYGIGMAGASFARQNLLSGAQGFGLFTGGVMAAAGGGLSREEMSMVGGVTGGGAMIARTQIGAALSPMGDMQLMAAHGGRALGSMFEMPGQALAAMSQGGDLIANMVHFETHKREMLRGTGAGGIRTMARQQLESMAGVLESVSPGVSHSDAMRFMAQQMGLNEVEAKLYAGAGGRGGGGGGGYGKAAQLEAALGVMSSSAAGAAGMREPGAMEASGFSGIGFGGAISGGMLGATVGGIGGAIVGAGVGLVASNWGAIKGVFGGGPPLFSSAEYKADYYNRQQAHEYESRMTSFRQEHGLLEVDRDVAANVYGANLRGMRLDFDAGAHSPIASAQTSSMFRAMGLHPVVGGPGTVYVDGRYYNSSAVQKIYHQKSWSTPVTHKELEKTREAAYETAYTDAGADLDATIDHLGVGWSAMQHPADKTGWQLKFASHLVESGVNRLTGRISDPKARALVQGALARDTVNSGTVRAFLGQAMGLGGSLEELPASAIAGRALAIGGSALIEATMSDESRFLARNFGSGGHASASRAYLDRQYSAYKRGVEEGGSDTGTVSGFLNNVFNSSLGEHTAMSQDKWLESQGVHGGHGGIAAATSARYWLTLGESSEYRRASAVAASGDIAKANQIVRAEQHRVAVSGPYRGLHMDAVDFGAKHFKHAMEGDPGGMANIIGAVAAWGIGAPKMMEEMVAKVSLADMAKHDIQSGETKLAHRRGTSHPGMAHTVGWGQQEEAMSTINKSLAETNKAIKRTAGMVDTLSKKISPGTGTTTTASDGPGR